MILVVLCSFFGAVVVRRFVPRVRALNTWCDRWVLNVALPALIVSKIPSASLDGTIAIPVVVAWAYLVVAAGLVILAGRLFSWSRTTVGTLMLITPLGNTSFLGLAVVELALSRDHLASALAFDQLGSFLALATYGSVIASVFGNGPGGVRPAIRRLVRFTPFVALVISVMLRTVEIPVGIHDVASAIGRTVAPVAMASLGLRFSLNRSAHSPSVVLIPLTLRLLALPALVYVCAVLIGSVGSIEWQTSVLESAMPPMVTAGVVAANSDLDGDLAAFVVGLGTIISLVTLTLWTVILR